MADETKLSTAIQENVLVLLTFDSEYFRWARHAISPELFDYSVYRTIAEKAIAFIDAYDAPPKDHIFDELDSHLKDPKRGNLFKDALRAMWQLNSDHRVNSTYVQTTLNNFRQRQQIINAIIAAGNHVKAGKLDKAKETITSGFRDVGNGLFNPGISLGNINAGLGSYRERSEFSSGIDAFNKAGIVPHRKELMVLQGSRKHGKSMFGVQLGVLALKLRKKVVHITLELSDQQTYIRYIQNLFSIPKDDAHAILRNSVLKTDDFGIATGIDFNNLDLTNRPSIQSDSIKPYLAKKMAKMKDIPKSLFIKEYGTRRCTMTDIYAYLDGLEQVHKFIPDFIIIDYLDLLKLDIANLRLEIGAAYQEARGLAVERDIPVVTFSQTNREGENAAKVTTRHTSEDYSKSQTADIWLVLQRTDAEHASNLARIYVDAARAVEDKFWVLVSQQYALAKFSVSSAKLPNAYNATSPWM